MEEIEKNAAAERKVTEVLKKSSESTAMEDSEAVQIEVNPEEVHQIIEKLPDERARKVMRAVMFERMYSGPIPPPEFLIGYKSVLPDAPERILKMAELEQQHRHVIDTKLADSHIKQNGQGQILGFVLAALFGIFSLILALKGHDWLAGIFGTTTIIGLAIIFVLHESPKKTEESDEDDKSQ